MKKLTSILLTLLLIFSLSGCFNNNSKPDSDEKPQIETPDDKDTTPPSPEEDGKPDPNPNPNPPPKPEVPEENVDNTERTFYLTTLNLDDKKESGGEIKTKGLGVAENLKIILEDVSKKYFDNKKITLTTIETIDNKKIAVIDLSDDSNYFENRMQGSTGGRITSYTLIENVLQRKYEGYWIDGVRFTLKGKPVIDTGHAPSLAKTTYR